MLDRIMNTPLDCIREYTDQKKSSSFEEFNLFLTNVPILHPLKTPENQRFRVLNLADDFRFSKPSLGEKSHVFAPTNNIVLDPYCADLFTETNTFTKIFMKLLYRVSHKKRNP